MAAPADTTWGNEISSGSNAGKIGISRVWSDQGTYEHADVTVWFWTKYGVTDTSNSYYYARDTEPQYVGSVSIRTSSSSGSGYSEANQVIIATYSYDFPKGTSDYTTHFNASITGIDALGSGNVSYASRPYTVYAIPAATSYHQVVYVRYQQADGNWGGYSAVISASYNVGSTVSWSRAEDAIYKAASISYGVNNARTSYIDVYRKTYVQTIKVSYEDENGVFGEYDTVNSSTYYYGATCNVSSFGGDVIYKLTLPFSYTVTENKTVYVHVYRNKYPIHFNSNGGLWTPPDQYYRYGGTTKLTKYRPTKSGYTFLGWSLDADATEVTYSHRGDFTFDDTEQTLYAIWKRNNQNIYIYDFGDCFASEFIEDSNMFFGLNGELSLMNFNEIAIEHNNAIIDLNFIEGNPLDLVDENGNILVDGQNDYLMYIE